MRCKVQQHHQVPFHVNVRDEAWASPAEGQAVIKLFINVRMKPELPQLKVQLHLAKGELHLHNIIKIIY